jgi:hypothetical protein
MLTYLKVIHAERYKWSPTNWFAFVKTQNLVIYKQPHAYVAHTKDRGILYDPKKSIGLEYFVDVTFAGGWHISTSTDADIVMSQAGFVTTYADCPIY